MSRRFAGSRATPTFAHGSSLHQRRIVSLLVVAS
jgi:hypothetical protein